MLKPFSLRDSAAHKKLLALAQTDGQRHLLELFKEDSKRTAWLSQETEGIFFDWSKHRVTPQVMEALFELAEEADWQDGVRQLYGGSKINQTESRAVLHMALRGEEEDPFQVDGEPVMAEVLATRNRMLTFADEVRQTEGITDVVNIGIGGSDLGPLMVTKALRAAGKGGPQLHFVSNVDGAHLESVLDQVKPEQTLFIVVSKTFTTQETMANAEAARDWLVEHRGVEAIGDHFAAVSTNVPAAENFGVLPNRIFGFADWVGGRYSLWGPVGLAIACSVGGEAFRELLAGARGMDRHFAEAAARNNAPLISALLGIWYREYLGFPTHVVLPYAQDLDRFPAYLQQADMESNGKYVGRDGHPVQHATGPVVWGEAGTNGQHAFYQLLHQGTTVHPADIIAVKTPMSKFVDHHRKLLANAIAQAEALMCGRSREQVEEEMESNGVARDVVNQIAPHRVFAGNRPSTFMLLDALSPRSLGALIAFYEHRIFMQGLLWNVCSFDQWGVELGKVLAKNVISDWSESPSGVVHDSSTAALILMLKG